MITKLAVTTVALAFLGASSAGAQPAPNPQPNPQAGGQPPALSREDAGAYLSARLAALHSGLQLTPEQEHFWPGFEKAYRDLANIRLEGGTAPPGNEDLMARLQRRGDFAARRGAALKALADAAAPLWQSLDDGQKRRFAALVRPGNFRAGFGPRDERDFGRGRFFGGPGRDRDGDRYGFGGRRDFGPDDRGGGERYGYGAPRGFGPREFGPRDFGGPGRGGDDGERRGFGPGGRDGAYGPRRFGFGGPGREDDSERYGYGGGRGYGPRDFGGPGRGDDNGYRRGFGPRGFGPRDQGREERDERDFGRRFGGAYGRGGLPWWHPDVGPRRGPGSEYRPRDRTPDQPGPGGANAPDDRL